MEVTAASSDSTPLAVGSSHHVGDHHVGVQVRVSHLAINRASRAVQGDSA